MVVQVRQINEKMTEMHQKVSDDPILLRNARCKVHMV